MTDTHWNYRVVCERMAGEEVFAICEVYYQDGDIKSWSTPQCGAADSVEGLSAVVQGFQAALEKPVLEEDIEGTTWTLKEVEWLK